MPATPFWIVDGVRTPFAKAGGALARTPAYELGRVAMAEVVARQNLDPDRLDHVVFGNVAQPAEAANSTRVAALRAGVPERVPGVTVHRNCASGMESVADAAYRIASGDAQLVLAGGMESMSQIPLMFRSEYADWMGGLMRAKTPVAKLGAATAFRPGMLSPRIALAEGLTDPVCGLNMGETAEVLAREFRITREAQDEFALESHRRAVASRAVLREEIVPMFPAPGYEPLLDDVGPRDNQTLDALAKLKPYFDRKNGSVTVGNACGVTDGACALLVAGEATVKQWPTPPMGRIRAFAFAGLSPRRMGLGPVVAMAEVVKKTGVTIDSIDLFEINEAFAAQVLACLVAAESDTFARNELGLDRALGKIPRDRLNVNGGAIALGHPVGVSGARLLLTLLAEMRRRGAKRGMAALCVGGGQGAAFLVERD